MDDGAHTPPAPATWLEALERSKAQIAAGQTVPLAPVLQRLRASVDRMESKRAKAAAPKA